MNYHRPSTKDHSTSLQKYERGPIPIGYWFQRIPEILREKGILYVSYQLFRRGLIRLSAPLVYFGKSRSRAKHFSVGRKNYPYFYHMYNLTWRNERAVEISFFRALTELYAAHEILEIGNVLGRYSIGNHVVVDKFEKGKRTINCDIIDYYPSKKYKLIVSISTLEHVGWDESPRDAGKTILAIEHVRSMLHHDGQAVFSVPVGYNPHLDVQLREKQLVFDWQYCMKRVSQNNDWCETTFEDIANMQYDKPFPSANGLIIGFIKP